MKAKSKKTTGIRSRNREILLPRNFNLAKFYSFKVVNLVGRGIASYAANNASQRRGNVEIGG